MCNKLREPRINISDKVVTVAIEKLHYDLLGSGIEIKSVECGR